MAFDADLYLEAERRGLLSPEQQGALDEMRRRGMVPGGQPARRPDTPAEAIRGAYAEPVAAMASGMIAKPISDVAGLAAIPLHAMGAIDMMPEEVKAQTQRTLSYEPRTRTGQAFMRNNPLAWVAQGVDELGAKAERKIAPPDAPYSNVRAGLGAGVREAINQAPGFIGAGSPKIAAAASAPLKAGARRTMWSALKSPEFSQRTGQTARAVDTLLDEGINVTRGGAGKLRGRVDALNTQIADAIANSNATVNKGKVGRSLADVYQDAARQTNPVGDLSIVDRAYKEWMNHPLAPTRDIPVQVAQEIKQGTYRSLGNKSYGEMKGREIESQKALARALKEGIADAVPEVRGLNAQESRLLDALPLVERRAMMEMNNNLVGLGPLARGPKSFLTFLADRSGLAKSLLARMLNAGAEGTQSLGVLGLPLIAAPHQQRDRRNRRKEQE